MGVNVPVHVILSVDVIVINVPFCTVISASLLNPITASKNTSSTVAVSPTFKEESEIVNVYTMGAVVSTVTDEPDKTALYSTPVLSAVSSGLNENSTSPLSVASTI